MAEPGAGEFRYAAFLSYSHKDSAAAFRLHRRLESFRMPRRLVGTAGARGPVPQRLWPIFRDREELPAATDLSETVREALGRSGALIVLCSPHAAQSLWVAEEIRTFRELHPDRPILAAVVDGDPPDSFPAALRAFGQDGTWHEPLATDLRRHADGERLGLLKLVAGITGVGLDDLVQRDAARRIRRVTAVTAVAVAAMLIMAVLTLVALDARREAERQRAEAEGLIEFMLTDLRDRLKGVGRLDAMEAVNARALRYYGEWGETAELRDESLARRARILHAIGHDNLHRHNLSAALTAFREAHHLTGELLTRSPDEARRIAEHAKSEVGIGRVYEMQGNWPMAKQHFAAFAAAADRLVAIDPDDPDHMVDVASGAVDLGNVELGQTRGAAAAHRYDEAAQRSYETAQRSYEKAVLWYGRAARLRPGNVHIRLAEANAYGWLADTFHVRALWQQSLAARRRQYSIVEPLHRADRANADILFRLAAAQRGLAHSYFRSGDRANARRHLFGAYGITVELVRREPNNGDWRSLKSLLAGDLFDLNLGLPAGVTETQLRRDQIEAHRTNGTAQH